MVQTIQADLLIVGMGAAASMAALYALDANPDLRILIATKALKVAKSLALFPNSPLPQPPESSASTSTP